jgi:hypothetical protein
LHALCTSDWEDLIGECHLHCLASVLSDHSPLLLDCTPSPTAHRYFRFEEFRLRQDGFHDVVSEAWQSVDAADPFLRLWLRLQATARMLTSWSARTVGSVRQRLALSREVILRLDKARENRMLSLDESWLHKTLKATYLGLASLERTIARQRTRLTSLKDGDANSAYFHQHCTYRWHKKRFVASSRSIASSPTTTT